MNPVQVLRGNLLHSVFLFRLLIGDSVDPEGSVLFSALLSFAPV